VKNREQNYKKALSLEQVIFIHGIFIVFLINKAQNFNSAPKLLLFTAFYIISGNTPSAQITAIQRVSFTLGTVGKNWQGVYIAGPAAEPIYILTSRGVCCVCS
jgi:hypothetical protein